MADKTYKSGSAAITVADTELLKHIDRVSAGAGSTFLRRTHEALETIEGDASARWLRRTGRSAEGFIVKPTVGAEEINQSLTNAAGYAGFIRYSVRTEEGLDAEADRAATRGNTPATQDAIRRFWRNRLTRRHGVGAPSAKLAGRRLWTELVDKPGKKASKTLVKELQADLDKLAGAD
mgnify:FL=1